MYRIELCPREGCNGTWTCEGRVVKGYPRSQYEPGEPDRFQVTTPPFAEDNHTCNGKLTDEEEAKIIQAAEEDPPEPDDDYDTSQEEYWWER